MPLTNAQKEFIEHSISHLLEFPENKDELSTGIEQLKSWIEHPPAHPDDNNVYYVLARCLRSPESSFQHIEDYGAAVTVQEVQQHLLSLITSALERAAAAGNTSLSDIGWDLTTPAALFSDESTDSPFKSVKVDYRPSLPWENIQDIGGIYHASLSINELLTHVLINVTIIVPGKPEPVLVTEELKKIPPGDMDQYHLLNKQLPLAKQVGRAIAAVTIINELRGFSLLSESDPFDYHKALHCHPLLANKIIATLLLQQKISISQLTTLSSEQIKSLSHPFAGHLIQAEICTLQAAAEIPANTLSAMQMYASLLENRLLNVSDFNQLHPDKATLLMHPLVVNLIHKCNLSFAAAAQLPSIIKELFSSSLYGDFFLNTDIKWSSLTNLKKKHTGILLNPEIANSIKLGLLTFDHLIYSSKRRRKKLRMKKIVSLLVNQTITLREIDKLSVSKCEVLNNHPLLRKWLRQGIISLNELNLRSLTPLYNAAFTKRLNAILDDHPYNLSNGKPDSSALLLSEIPRAESYAKAAPGELQKNAVEKIIHHLKLKIETVCLSETMTNAKPLHRKLHHFISTIDLQHASPQACLANIIDAANQYNKQPASGILFFGRQRQDREAFSQLCCRLETLRGFTESPTVNSAPLSRRIT